jgi:hypothetical protein
MFHKEMLPGVAGIPSVNGMTSVLVITCVVAALLLGIIAGWVSRRHAHWCPRCGGRLTCAVCRSVRREIGRPGRVYPLDAYGNSGPGGTR